MLTDHSSTTFQWFTADDSQRQTLRILVELRMLLIIPADGTLNGKHLFVKVTTTDSKVVPQLLNRQWVRLPMWCSDWCG